MKNDGKRPFTDARNTSSYQIARLVKAEKRRAKPAKADAAIIRAATLALMHDPLIPHEHIRLTVKDGHLTLEGEVSWRGQKIAAENTVRQLSGVKGIDNKITPRAKPKSPAGRSERRTTAIGRGLEPISGAKLFEER